MRRLALALAVPCFAASDKELDRLYRDGMEAYKRAEWGKAAENFEDVIKADPNYKKAFDVPPATVVSKVTAPANSLPARFEPVKIIDCKARARKVIDAAKDHEAEVVRSVHAPETDQAPPVFVMKAFAALTVALRRRPPKCWTRTGAPPAGPSVAAACGRPGRRHRGPRARATASSRCGSIPSRSTPTGWRSRTQAN